MRGKAHRLAVPANGRASIRLSKPKQAGRAGAR
jgi:hypothetical protein